MHELISGLSTLFRWSMCLFFMPVSYYIFYATFDYYGYSSKYDIPSFVLLSQVALAIWTLLWFHVNLRIVISISIKNAIGSLIRIALNQQMVLDSMDILTKLILPTRTHNAFSFICVFNSLQCLTVVSI